MGITYRQGHEGRLSVQEMDDNFHYIEEQLAGLTQSNSDRLISTNNLEAVLDIQGTLNTPLLETISFTASCDEVHLWIGPVGFTDDNWWQFDVSFQVNPDGSVETMINNIFPILTNPGYTSGMAFRFTEADHGIPNFNFDIQLNDVTLPGGAGWTANISATQPPTYPSTIKSLGNIKITAGSDSIILGTDGVLSIPNSITFPDNSVQTTAYPGIPTSISSGITAPGSAVVANETNVNINFSDGVGTAWSFDPTSITLKNGSMIKAGQYTILNEGGISRICSIGYEELWQGGIRYVFDNNGLIREATNCFSFIPDGSFNYSKRFKVGSRWILDNGDLYECTYDGSGMTENAEWKFVPKVAYKVFTALLTQNGGDGISKTSSGALTQGVTYYFDVLLEGEWDFSNVGGPVYPNNNSFIATSNDTPNSYGGQSIYYNTGAPVVTVLENTIGNIWFTYSSMGSSYINSSGLFTVNKTAFLGTATAQGDDLIITGAYINDSKFYIQISNGFGTYGSTIEIRVYN